VYNHGKEGCLKPFAVTFDQINLLSPRLFIYFQRNPHGGELPLTCPGVNSINIILTPFSYECALRRVFSNYSLALKFFVGAKAASKMLMKLTTECSSMISLRAPARKIDKLLDKLNEIFDDYKLENEKAKDKTLKDAETSE